MWSRPPPALASQLLTVVVTSYPQRQEILYCGANIPRVIVGDISDIIRHLLIPLCMVNKTGW